MSWVGIGTIEHTCLVYISRASLTEVRIKKETEIGLVHIHFDFMLTCVYMYILYTRANMSRENI